MSSPEEQNRQALHRQQRQMEMIVAQQTQQQFQMMQQRQQQAANQAGNQMRQQMTPQSGLQMGTPYDDVPVKEANDVNILNGRSLSQPEFASFISACQEGDLSKVESAIASQPRTPAYLYQGLIKALENGKVDVVRYLLDSEAPICRNTPTYILEAPEQEQIPCFELLTEHGWNVNTPGFYGTVLLPRVIQTNNNTLIDWFLAQGADPNLGSQHDNRDRLGKPDEDSCQALELAAKRGSAELVRKLLSAGAKIENGAPLYHAAGACPVGANPHAGLVAPGEEFDRARIPVMEVLVEHGAGVNDKFNSRYVTPKYPIVNAVMAGAVERVKWLLSQGADPDLKGRWGSARDYAKKVASDEMKHVLGV
ncbi:hypothetical protein FHETE_7056 [Fusarium heterosporum]|uniref:Uncharacterized protein n=1 Tax=Fusarium heterosporum TaxID=42747 RepID=A0A8H5T2L2_FUSHE|nr:hypothetical protein FHETE_7056 [Fusarium heterosporum]